VENLLTAAQVQNEALRLHLGPVPFDELCAEVVEGMQPGARRIRLSVGSDLPILLTDRNLLGRVLGNLLDNALKYSPEGSRCEVGARRLGRRLEFWVRDQGIGIPPSELGHIFDRFYQVDSSPTRKYMGVGLGLSLVRDLVRDLGGSLAVASRQGEGSTFTVRIPIRHPLAASDEGDERPRAVASQLPTA
jgi:signal transduction histidine kinase